MKKLKYILSIIIIAATLLSVTSCGKIRAATELPRAMPSTDSPIAFDTTLAFTSDDVTALQLFDSYKSMTVRTVIDGENIKTVTKKRVNGGRLLETTQTLIDDILYIRQELTTAGVSLESVKMRAALTEEQVAEFIGEEENSLAINDFKKVTREKVDGAIVYTMTGYHKDAKSGLEEIAEPVLDEDMTVEVRNVTAIYKVEDVRLTSETVKCDFYITDGDAAHTVSMTMSVVYDYGEVNPVSEPIGKDNYQWVAYE